MKISTLNLCPTLSPSNNYYNFKDSQEEQSHLRKLEDKFREIARENDRKEARSIERASRMIIF